MSWDAETEYEIGYIEGLRQALYIILHAREEDLLDLMSKCIQRQDKLVKRLTKKICFADECENEFNDVEGHDIYCWECRY